MRRMRFVIFTVLLGFFGTVEAAGADDAADAWKALRAGGHVALMRHADAPGGVGDPPDFRVEDCATQRNLSAKGRADAEKIGLRLKAEGIAFEKIQSSPWCRCIDTANLLKLGTVETESTFGNVVVLKDQRQTLTAGARALIAQWTAGGNLLVVTHGANVQALTGVWLARGRLSWSKAAAIASSLSVACSSIEPDPLELSRLSPRVFVAIPVPVRDHGLISGRLRNSLDGRACALCSVGLHIRKNDKESEQPRDHHPVDQESRSQPVFRFGRVVAM